MYTVDSFMCIGDMIITIKKVKFDNFVIIHVIFLLIRCLKEQLLFYVKIQFIIRLSDLFWFKVT